MADQVMNRKGLALIAQLVASTLQQRSHSICIKIHPCSLMRLSTDIYASEGNTERCAETPARLQS